VQSFSGHKAYLTSEHVWQIGNQILLPDSVAKVIPEIGALFSAGFAQAGEGILRAVAVFYRLLLADSGVAETVT